jgi:hypothetical protein
MGKRRVGGCVEEHGVMSEQPVDGAVTAQVARELGAIRQRGLEELDLGGSSQKPKETPAIDRLGHQYCEAAAVGFHGRIAQIRKLLQDALAAYAERGNQYESQLLWLLFFDPDEQQTGRRRRPGALLDAARERRGLDVGRFKLYLDTLFTGFASFLIAFVAEARDAADLAAGSGQTALVSAAAPASQRRRRLLSLAGTVLVVVVGGSLTAAFVLRLPLANTCSPVCGILVCRRTGRRTRSRPASTAPSPCLIPITLSRMIKLQR